MFYDNFELACKQKGLKPNPVAMKCGGSRSSATSWKNGSVPNSEIVVKIAEYLQVSTDFLLRGTENTLTEKQRILLEKYNRLSAKNQHRVDERIDTLLEIENDHASIRNDKINFITIRHSLHKVSAGSGFDLLNEGDLWDYIQVPDTYESQRCDYALTIDGDSMLPLYANGDIVLIKSQEQIDIGQIGVFIVDGELAYIKKLGTDRLISLNDDYDDIYFSETVQPVCKGLVLGKV